MSGPVSDQGGFTPSFAGSAKQSERGITDAAKTTSATSEITTPIDTLSYVDGQRTAG